MNDYPWTQADDTPDIDALAQEAGEAMAEDVTQETIGEHYPLMLADTMAHGTGGKYYHAHNHDARGGGSAAICGRKPGRRGYWGYYFGDKVTCPRCIKMLEAIK